MGWDKRMNKSWAALITELKKLDRDHHKGDTDELAIFYLNTLLF
jgi:hypothetical protein